MVAAIAAKHGVAKVNVVVVPVEQFRPTGLCEQAVLAIGIFAAAIADHVALWSYRREAIGIPDIPRDLMIPITSVMARPASDSADGNGIGTVRYSPSLQVLSGIQAVSKSGISRFRRAERVHGHLNVRVNAGELVSSMDSLGRT